MSDQLYGTIVVDSGLSLVTSAVKQGQRVNLITLAVGDGGGEYYMPTRDMTQLKRECWRGDVNNIGINEFSPNLIDVAAIIPATVGGFTIREMSVITDNGVTFAICNTPAMEKVVITTGAGGEIELSMHIKLENTEAVSFDIDPNVVTASKKDIENHDKSAAAHAEKFENIPKVYVSETEPPDWKPGDYWYQILRTRAQDGEP